MEEQLNIYLTFIEKECQKWRISYCPMLDFFFLRTTEEMLMLSDASQDNEVP